MVIYIQTHICCLQIYLLAYHSCALSRQKLFSTKEMLEIEGSHLYLDKEGALTTRLVSMLLQKQNEKKKNEKMRNAHLNFINH